MSQKKLKVVVYSDYICPFCYIGYHRIEKLKEQYNLDVEWQPFELHPEIPKNGANLDDLPFPRGYIEMVMANVMKLAEEDGIEMNFSGKIINSRLALYISEFMREKGKFDEYHKLVLDAYWKKGKDIGNQEFLLDLAESIGLERQEILDYLKTNEPRKRLKKALLALRGYGITGVPTFLIDGRPLVGAQPYEIFERVINIALEAN